MRRRRRPYYNANHDRWLISYADYVTLLLALFVVLYAMSSVDVERLQTMVSGMRTAFVETGTEAGGIDRALPEPGGSESESDAGTDPDADDVPYVVLRDRIETTLERAGGSDEGNARMQTHRSDRGLVISLAAEDFFESGETRILGDALGPLNAIGSVLALSALPIRVEGHTDDRPIESERFPSNWELSTARASAVARHLIEHLEIAPTRIGASGYAEYRPIAPNDSEKNRALNRRIDIVVLKSDRAAIEEPAAPEGQDRSELESLLERLPPVEEPAARDNVGSTLSPAPNRPEA